ncbi:hypothetical protein D3C73_905100 [compost metagenome]
MNGGCLSPAFGAPRAYAPGRGCPATRSTLTSRNLLPPIDLPHTLAVTSIHRFCTDLCIFLKMYNLAHFGRNHHVSYSTLGSSGSQSTTLQASPHRRPRLLVRRYGRGSGRIPAPAHPGTVGPQHRQPRIGWLGGPVRLLLRRDPGRLDGRPLWPQEGHALGPGLLLPHVSGGGHGPQLRNLPDCTDLCRFGRRR